MSKSPEAFRTISEVAGDLDLPQHVLRFWETRFGQIRPMKRGGGRRYYRPDDVELLRGIRHLLYGEGYTIRGVQRILREQGPRFVIGVGRGEDVRLPAHEPGDEADGGMATATHDVAEPRMSVRAERMDEIGPDDHDPDEEEPVPVLHPMPHRPAIRTAEPPQPVPPVRPAVGGLSRDDAGRLRATLGELLECKRILDQAR